MPPLKTFFSFRHVPTARKVVLVILAIVFWLFFFWGAPGDAPTPPPDPNPHPAQP